MDDALEESLELQCNLDDASPELIGALTERILQRGALDVFLTPVQMKKQRPGVLLTVLCRPEQRLDMLDEIFRESTAFGVREHSVRRTVLARRYAQVATPYGPVRVKSASGTAVISRRRRNMKLSRYCRTTASCRCPLSMLRPGALRQNLYQLKNLPPTIKP